MRSLLSRFGHSEQEQHPVTRVTKMLQTADAETLKGRKRILAVAILHQMPHHGMVDGHAAARSFVEQYKKPGWVPPGLTVAADTPIEMVHVAELPFRTASDLNGQLAEVLVGLVPDARLERCAAIGFSGDNTALGFTLFGILAT